MDELLNTSVRDLRTQYPFFDDFFLAYALRVPDRDADCTVGEYFDRLEYFSLDEVGIDREELPEYLKLFLENMLQRQSGSEQDVETITICAGHDKSGTPEPCSITLKKGDVVSIVGPTGSGKSRLLSDIEWLAQNDTPTGRSILINGKKPEAARRFSIEKKPVAQLSQNMNFVMDISVEKFLQIHCDSRMITDAERVKEQILTAANTLAGEPIRPEMPITSLSGGQSRALMIADTAYVSTSPIILIDEIENAGINRKNAIELLVRSEKIVLIATHDPVLALRADRRLVIRNGGIAQVLHTSPEERSLLQELEAMNDRLNTCRELLREGKTLTP